MAEALVSCLLERLTSVSEQLREEYLYLGVGVEKQVENLILNLKDVQSVLVDAEVRQLMEAPVRKWLDNLKQVCYKIDNLMAELSVQVNKQSTAPSGAKEKKKKKKKKVCLPILSDSFCLLKTISWKIRELAEELTLIANQRFQFQYQRIERSVGKIKRQKVLSLVKTDRIFGREEELEILLSKLVRVGREHETSPVVIPIVGMGGIGKTTLAKLACNDDRVKTHFEERIWVYVSDPFDEVRIAKVVIESIKHETPRSNEIEVVLECMSECIRGKRFLLVLDDVWTEERKWKNLMLILQNGAVGSRVVVTTRNKGVARMMRGTTNMIILRSLRFEDCFLLFSDYAQFDREKDGSAKYEAIAKVLVRRCDGSPLLAKMLGSLMLYKETIIEWEDVLNIMTIWEFENVELQIFQVLLRSYYDLTPAIKPCLLYCAIFPYDFVIDKDSLIQLWMSQDYLSSERNEDKETVGHRYFEELVIRFFFQDFEKDEEGNIRWCRMNAIVHDCLQFLTKGECITLDEGSLGVGEFSKIHHLTLRCASKERPQGSFSISHFKDLRTITTFDSEISTHDLDLIMQLKYLRTLSLNCGHIREVPTSIGSSVHLRYHYALVLLKRLNQIGLNKVQSLMPYKRLKYVCLYLSRQTSVAYAI